MLERNKGLSFYSRKYVHTLQHNHLSYNHLATALVNSQCHNDIGNYNVFDNYNYKIYWVIIIIGKYDNGLININMSIALQQWLCCCALDDAVVFGVGRYDLKSWLNNNNIYCSTVICYLLTTTL